VVPNGFEPGAVIIPLTDMKAVENVESHITDAQKRDSNVITGGKRSTLRQYLLRADRATDLTTYTVITQGGAFAPVASLYLFKREAGGGRGLDAQRHRIQTRRRFLQPRPRPLFGVHDALANQGLTPSGADGIGPSWGASGAAGMGSCATSCSNFCVVPESTSRSPLEISTKFLRISFNVAIDFPFGQSFESTILSAAQNGS
jgi:hypothetical protein